MLKYRTCGSVLRWRLVGSSTIEVVHYFAVRQHYGLDARGHYLQKTLTALKSPKNIKSKPCSSIASLSKTVCAFLYSTYNLNHVHSNRIASLNSVRYCMSIEHNKITFTAFDQLNTMETAGSDMPLDARQPAGHLPKIIQTLRHTSILAQHFDQST